MPLTVTEEDINNEYKMKMERAKKKSAENRRKAGTSRGKRDHQFSSINVNGQYSHLDQKQGI